MMDYFIKRLMVYSIVQPINIIWRLIAPPEITDLPKFLSPNKPQTDFSDQPLCLSVSQWPVVLFAREHNAEALKGAFATKAMSAEVSEH